jgi:hypothetical protein
MRKHSGEEKSTAGRSEDYEQPNNDQSAVNNIYCKIKALSEILSLLS